MRVYSLAYALQVPCVYYCAAREVPLGKLQYMEKTTTLTCYGVKIGDTCLVT
jgi:hypothetical protein